MHGFSPRRSLVALAGSILLGATLAGCGGGASSAPPVAGVQSVARQAPVSAAATLVASQGETGASLSVAKNATPNFTYTAATAHVYAPHAASSTASAKPARVVYPSDLQYYGGPLMQTAKVYNVFVDSTPSQFNYPRNFLMNLFSSSMIHILDQYEGSTANGRYLASGGVTVTYPAFTTLGDNDLLLILHAVGAYLAPTGSSKNVYNIFLAPGLNYCGSGTIFPNGECNASATSPNPAFCAFHSEVTFSDVGEVLYNLQPYQDVNYCAVNFYFPSATMPNGLQADTQDSSLSHELFETFTDPLPGSGWYDANSPAVSGEIGDLCAYISSQTVKLNAKRYFIQGEYSNAIHACTVAPPTPAP